MDVEAGTVSSFSLVKDHSATYYWMQKALTELDIIITKAAEIEDLNEKIRNANQAKDLRTEFRLRDLRAAAQL